MNSSIEISNSIQLLFREKGRKEQLISHINESKENFDAFLSFSLLSDEPLAWRAAWVLRSCINKNDQRISERAIEITKAIAGKEDGHQRELIKNLEHIKLEESYEGYLFDACMNIWEDLSKIPSTRITAFKAMNRIAKKYPELKQDLILLTEDHYTESLTSGIAATLKKEIKKLV